MLYLLAQTRFRAPIFIPIPGGPDPDTPRLENGWVAIFGAISLLLCFLLVYAKRKRLLGVLQIYLLIATIVVPFLITEDIASIRFTVSIAMIAIGWMGWWQARQNEASSEQQ